MIFGILFYQGEQIRLQSKFGFLILINNLMDMAANPVLIKTEDDPDFRASIHARHALVKLEV